MLRLALLLIPALLVPAVADAQTVAVPSEDRAAVTATISGAINIATPEGVSERELVDVGDDKQWISIRGRNRANPVLLFIHGGPGTPQMPLSWAYQSPWEDYFTVVNWDQRGVGKNALTANGARLAPTTSLDRIVRDGEAVIAHLRQKLGKDKIVVLGFSWGSTVGVELVKRRPEWVSAYVGVGQSVGPSDEAILYRETIAAAAQRGDTDAVTKLKALGPYPRADGSTPIDVARSVRSYAVRYDGLWYGQTDFRLLRDMAYLSPDYDEAELAAARVEPRWMADAPVMRDLMTVDLRTLGRDFPVPMFLFLGRYDLFTPYAAARDWFDGLRAPHKELVTFERASHFVMLEEPGRFLTALVDKVLPIAGGAPPYKVTARREAAKP